MPQRMRSRIIASLLLEGPRVQTILARRRAAGCESCSFRILTLLPAILFHRLRDGNIGTRSEKVTRVAQGVELGSDKYDERDQVEPDEESDRGGKRAVDLVVVGKVTQVGSEKDGGNKPHDGREDGPGQDSVPWLSAGQAVMVDQGDHGDAGERGDDPTKGSPHAKNVSSEFVAAVKDHPALDLVPEGNQETGKSHGNAGHDHQHERHHAFLDDSPDLGKVIGLTEAFHPGDHYAGGGPKGNDGHGYQASDGARL